MRGRSSLVLMMLVAVWPVGAAGAGDPVIDFADPPGDTALGWPVGIPATGPAFAGVDILRVTVARAEHLVVGDAVYVTHYLADLDALVITNAGVLADTMFGLQVELQGTGRDGQWTTRADYVPSTGQPWTFWAEGPCLQPGPNGACPGEFRDIHEGLPGMVSYADDTVTVVFPLSLLQGHDGALLYDAGAFTDMVWPSWPVYIGDRAQDLSGTVVVL